MESGILPLLHLLRPPEITDMREQGTSRLPEILGRHEREILEEWVRLQLSAETSRRDLIQERELTEQSREFLAAFRSAISQDGQGDLDSPAWGGVREVLVELSRNRARQGFSSSETATFVFS